MMSDTFLPWRLFGRKIMPYALGVTLFMFLYAYTLLVYKNDTGDALDLSLVGYVIGWICLLNGIMMTIGWFKMSKLLLTYGLLISVGVFVTRGVYILLDEGFSVTGVGSLILGLVMSLGAFTLEKLDDKKEL